MVLSLGRKYPGCDAHGDDDGQADEDAPPVFEERLELGENGGDGWDVIAYPFAMVSGVCSAFFGVSSY